MTLFPIEFYVPRNESDATKEVCTIPLTCHVIMGKKKMTTLEKVLPYTAEGIAFRKMIYVLHVFYSCLNHNLFLINNVFNYCAFSKLYLIFKGTILKL